MENTVSIKGYSIPVYTCNTAVVGSGAAGLAALVRLHYYGCKDIVLVTERMNAGTSRNTGSDKQTYYKMSLSGGDADSIHAMAEDLFAGKCVDGDLALCEAALSVPCFLRLAELGVPFPQNQYGEYVGYKTDHDPARRASSAGPYTSKLMTECLEKAVKANGTPILDNWQVVRILTDSQKKEATESAKTLRGLLCVDVSADAKREKRISWLLINCCNVVWATGGPAGMYADSVYPVSQLGATGLALEAGASGKNLTEWQYGLSSVKPRWNVSGTYMQALPVFVSVNSEGGDEREFLLEEYGQDTMLYDHIFLKGYQWPFDYRKREGSSKIDLLVYRETVVKGRRVYLDYRRNPGGSIPYEKLSKEAGEYLEKAGACFGTPVERLIHMNQPAYEYYFTHGVDLRKERLEIALCAQHNNGGIAVDKWWRTAVEGLFGAGEVCATHGVYRPGGAALNAGQVGAERAARYISAYRQDPSVQQEEFLTAVWEQVESRIEMADKVFFNSEDAAAKKGHTDVRTVYEVWKAAEKRMSRCGAAIRSRAELEKAVRETKDELVGFASLAAERDKADTLFHAWDALLSQFVYLKAMLNYIENGGSSRGSVWYQDEKHNVQNTDPELIQEVCLTENTCSFSWRPPRAIPDNDEPFETVWRNYRKDANVRD